MREIQRGLSAKLNDDAFWFFLLIDIEHVLEREWLEVKFVARVVIGRNRFRIRIDHDRFEPELAQGEGGVHAAVIKLNPLADPVRSAAENHHLAFATLAPLVLVAVSRVIIRRVSFELRRAGIDQPISRGDAASDSYIAQFPLICALFYRELTIAEA